VSQAARSTSPPDSEARAGARPPQGAPRPRPGRDRPPEPRPRTRIGPIGPVRRTVILVALAVAVASTVQWAAGRHSDDAAHNHAATPGATAHPDGAGAVAGHGAAPGATPASARVAYEPYHRPDPTLPAVPAGPVKRFRVDVLMHRTKVAADQPPLRVWSFGVNGRFMRGTGVSPPMVVEQGDRVDVTFVNGSSRAMHVDMAHSLDIHAAELPPNVAFKTIPPGATTHYRFVARHPGVYMYHCATQPMVWHLGSGMVGMFVVKPRTLPKVDRELWLVQQEYFLPRTPGADSDYAKMLAEKPDVIAFNGYANQYMRHPIRVRAGERIRMYVLNPGPTHTSSFHVIGAVFDRFRSEGVTGGPAQVMALPPSTGGWVDFTLRGDGAFPFVDHNFASMAKGAMGTLLTTHAPPGAARGF
jgi:nitrite reductase (NO-forming)